MSNTNTVTVNNKTITMRQARSQARAIVARMYGRGYAVGLGVEVEKKAFFGAPEEALVVTVRGPKGRLSAPVLFQPA